MKFERVEIDNFMSIGRAIINLDNRGLVLIQGDNQDETSAASNGAGKSAAVESISFALFNKTARGLSGDAVVNRSVGKDCRVSLELADRDQRYRIVRHRKHQTGKNRLEVYEIGTGPDGQEIDLTKGTDALTQELVTEIVGCSYEVFTSAVYAGQETFPDLPSMTDKMLKTLIEEASGVERLTRAYDVARAQLNDAKRDYDLLDQQLDRVSGEVQRLESELAQQRQAEQSWNHQRQQDLEQEAKALEEKQVALRAAEAAIDQVLRERIQVGLDKIRERFDAIQPSQDAVARLQRMASQDHSQWEVAKTERLRCDNQLERVRQELASLGQKVGKPCGECGKLYAPEDLESARQIIEQRIVEIEAQRRQAEQHEQACLDRYNNATKAVTDQRAVTPDVTQLSTQQERLLQERDRLQAEDQRVQQMRSELSEHRQRFEQMQAQVNPVSQTVSFVERSLEEKRSERDQLLSKRQTALDDLSLAKDAAEVFGAAGVRAEILDTVTPFLNERTAQYLGMLSDGSIRATWQTLTRNKKGEPKERFSIDVTSTTGGDSYRSISGGEKRKVRLATALALSDLVASRASKPINLFIGDEIDNAVDEYGLQRLMDVLESKARERGTVLVISHNDLAGYIRHTLTVTKQGGVSWVE